jgi:hypothetical protein
MLPLDRGFALVGDSKGVTKPATGNNAGKKTKKPGVNRAFSDKNQSLT